MGPDEEEDGDGSWRGLLLVMVSFNHYYLLDFPKYKYSGRLSGDRKSLKAIPARIYSVNTISQ